jgi:hypothetical protein
MPICEVEDCSDVAAVAQPGLWFDPDSHDTYVIWTDGPALLVVDDTVTGPDAFDAGAYDQNAQKAKIAR